MNRLTIAIPLLFVLGCAKPQVEAQSITLPRYFLAEGTVAVGPYRLTVKGPAELSYQFGSGSLSFPLDVTGPSPDVSVELKRHGEPSQFDRQRRKEKFSSVHTNLSRDFTGGEVEIEGAVIVQRTVDVEFVTPQKSATSGALVKLQVVGKHAADFDLRYGLVKHTSGIAPTLEIIYDAVKLFPKTGDKPVNPGFSWPPSSYSFSVQPASSGKLTLSFDRDLNTVKEKSNKLRLQQDLGRLPFKIKVRLIRGGTQEAFGKALNLKPGRQPLF